MEITISKHRWITKLTTVMKAKLMTTIMMVTTDNDDDYSASNGQFDNVTLPSDIKEAMAATVVMPEMIIQTLQSLFSDTFE